MKKILFYTALMTGLALSSSAHADYSAMAAGDGGFAWASGHRSMESARRAAVNRCRVSGYGSCTVSVAERDNWYFSGGWCGDRTYVGASAKGWWRSDQIVRMKGAADGNYDCYIEWQK